jgi:hypothetical protein
VKTWFQYLLSHMGQLVYRYTLFLHAHNEGKYSPSRKDKPGGGRAAPTPGCQVGSRGDGVSDTSARLGFRHSRVSGWLPRLSSTGVLTAK